jgi:hypothetical protein
MHFDTAGEANFNQKGQKKQKQEVLFLCFFSVPGKTYDRIALGVLDDGRNNGEGFRASFCFVF